MNKTGIVYDHVFEMDNYNRGFPFDHNIIEIDNGNILALVYDSQSEYVEDGMI
jgi:hypothetical protein